MYLIHFVVEQPNYEDTIIGGIRTFFVFLIFCRPEVEHRNYIFVFLVQFSRTLFFETSYVLSYSDVVFAQILFWQYHVITSNIYAISSVCLSLLIPSSAASFSFYAAVLRVK